MIEMHRHLEHPALHPVLTQPRNGIDVGLVQPQRGQLYHLAGPGRAGSSMRPVAEHWIAHALAEGEVVHWVDGACRINPSRLIPALDALGADTEACLSRLYLSRGFTLHQLDRQLERLPKELAITRSPLVVVDGLLAMHEDDAVQRLESRVLLRRQIALLQHITDRHHIAVIVITERHATTSHQQRLIRHVHRASHNHLHGHWQGSRRRRHLHLFHPRSGLQGAFTNRLDTAQARFVIPTRRLNNQKDAPSIGSLPLHHEEQ